MLRFLSVIVVLFASVAWAAEFHNTDKHYALRYDEQAFTLVHPGQLSTDFVLHKKESEHGFYPNLTLVSEKKPPQFKLKEAVHTTRTHYQSLLPRAIVTEDSTLVWRGYDAHLLELQYSRNHTDLYLRTILLATNDLFLSMSITLPIETKDKHLAAFMAVLDTMELDPWPTPPSNPPLNSPSLTTGP